MSIVSERLEFLGDRIYGAIVTDHILKVYSSDLDESNLTNIYNFYARMETQIKLLKMIKPEIKLDPRVKTKKHSDEFEIMVGSRYLKSGFDDTYKWLLPYLDKIEMVEKAITLADINIAFSKKYRGNCKTKYDTKTNTLLFFVGGKLVFGHHGSFNKREDAVKDMCEKITNGEIEI